MKENSLFRTLMGGFLATLVMTALMYLASEAGAPRMDIAARLGTLFGHGVPGVMTGWWWAGMIFHFVNGTIICSLIYSYFVYGWLPGSHWFRGMLWGIVVWVVMEVTLMPVTGSGIFGDHAASPLARIAISFIAYGMYGAILGALAGTQTKHVHHQPPHPA